MYRNRLFNPVAALQRACDGLVMGAAIDCADILAPGIRKRLIGFNLEDIENVDYDIVNTNVVEAITLKSGAQAWVFEGIKQSIIPNLELVNTPTASTWRHSVTLSIFDVSSEQKLNIQGMATKASVWIVENANDSSNADSIFEIYGLQRGLEAQTITRSPVDTESGAAFVVEMATPDEGGNEPVPVESWFITDYATTLLAVESLLTPAP